MVFSTAFGTALFGFLIDIGFSIEHIAVVSGAYIFGSIILLYLVKNKLNPNYLKNSPWFLETHCVDTPHGKSYRRRLYR